MNRLSATLASVATEVQDQLRGATRYAENLSRDMNDLVSISEENCDCGAVRSKFTGCQRCGYQSDLSTTLGALFCGFGVWGLFSFCHSLISPRRVIDHDSGVSVARQIAMGPHESQEFVGLGWHWCSGWWVLALAVPFWFYIDTYGMDSVDAFLEGHKKEAEELDDK